MVDKKRLEEEAMVVREGAAMALVWIASGQWTGNSRGGLGVDVRMMGMSMVLIERRRSPVWPIVV